jgi:hypothetical protein
VQQLQVTLLSSTLCRRTSAGLVSQGSSKVVNKIGCLLSAAKAANTGLDSHHSACSLSNKERNCQPASQPAIQDMYNMQCTRYVSKSIYLSKSPPDALVYTSHQCRDSQLCAKLLLLVVTTR